MKIAVVCGGFSEEQNASRKSGGYIAGALEKLSHTVEIVEYNEHMIDNLKKNAFDIVFHSVMGKHHGDGAVQALLELAGFPYTGSGPQSAAIINHKTICKKIWKADGILTPDFFEYSYREYKKDTFTDFWKKVNDNKMTLPVVAKAPTQGSRHGIVFVKDDISFNALESAFFFDNILLAESYVEGRFITQGIIEIEGEMTALPPVELIDSSGAEFKLFPGGSIVRDPCLRTEQTAEITLRTLKAAALTGASGYARLDYHICNGEFYLLEINAVPGLIPAYSSMIDCATAAGYDYFSLINFILSAAVKRSNK